LNNQVFGIKDLPNVKSPKIAIMKPKFRRAGVSKNEFNFLRSTKVGEL